MDIAKRLCGDFNGRYKDATPAEVAGYTILAVLCAQQVWRAATTPVADHVEAFQEVFFRNLRKYFGDRLGMSAALVEAQTGFLKEFAEQEESLPADTQSRTQLVRLPEKGVPRAELLRTIESLATINRDFSKGQFSGSIYHGGDHGYTDFINAAMAAHQWSNPLHAGQFGGVRKMEAEIIQMCVSMFNGPKGACGAITSGGTESILLAMKAYREYAYEKRGVQRGQGEIVAPVTVHAAFDKAAHYFGLKLRHAKVDPVTFKVDVAHFRSLINRNTIVLVGSAPHYPHGIVDPIEEIAALGRKWDLPVHVDCCLGGFILPFMEKAGVPIDERFDFRVDGVTSISVDSHKYGFAPKGSSCILWRNAALRTHQMHSQPNWPGGIYASPTIAGSRMGNVVAGTYAAMVSHGMDGYVESCREIVTASRYMAAEFAKIPGVKVLGKPLGSVVAFGSDDFDIYRLLGEMSARGYELSALQYPSALHVCVTRVHAMDDMKNAKLLVADVRSVAEELMRTKDQKATGGVALYGTSQQIPDRSIVGDVAKTYFDAYYTVDCEFSRGEGMEEGAEAADYDDSVQPAGVEIGQYATWSVSTAKHGNGVGQLRDGNLQTYWQSDGTQPHLIDVQWNSNVRVMRVELFLDFGTDESYTPKKLTLRAGNTYHDLQDIATHDLNEPQGWVTLTSAPDSAAHCVNASLIQIAILENHQNGRDSHVRQVRVLGPPLNMDHRAYSSLSFSHHATWR